MGSASHCNVMSPSRTLGRSSGMNCTLTNLIYYYSNFNGVRSERIECVTNFQYPTTWAVACNLWRSYFSPFLEGGCHKYEERVMAEDCPHIFCNAQIPTTKYISVVYIYIVYIIYKQTNIHFILFLKLYFNTSLVLLVLLLHLQCQCIETQPKPPQTYPGYCYY